MFDLVPFRKRSNDLMNSFFGKSFIDDFFNNDFFPMHGNASSIRADIKENDKEYVIEAEMPGFDKEEIEIELNDNYLTISANRNEIINEEKENYIRKERRTGRITRSFYVENVKNEGIKASHKDGILKIILPKEKEGKKKGNRIQIH